MFGLNEALMSFIRRQVGLRTDAANANGSLHAKVAESRNTIYNYLQNTINPRIYPFASKTPLPVSNSGQATSGAESTLISVSGSGWFMGCSFKCTSSNNSGFATPRLKINGSIVWEGTPMTAGNVISCFIFARYTYGMSITLYGTEGISNLITCYGIVLPD